MMHGKPVPGTYVLSWKRPRHTPVAPCHSWKSLTFTVVPALASHHCGVGNFMYWIVSRTSPLNLNGGGRIWPATRPPRPAIEATVAAPIPIWTHSRRVIPRSRSSFSQLIVGPSSERPTQNDLRTSNLVNQLVRHELSPIDVEGNREEEEHHPQEDAQVGIGLVGDAEEQDPSGRRRLGRELSAVVRDSGQREDREGEGHIRRSRAEDLAVNRVGRRPVHVSDRERVRHRGVAVVERDDEIEGDLREQNQGLREDLLRVVRLADDRQCQRRDRGRLRRDDRDEKRGADGHQQGRRYDEREAFHPTAPWLPLPSGDLGNRENERSLFIRCAVVPFSP